MALYELLLVSCFVSILKSQGLSISDESAWDRHCRNMQALQSRDTRNGQLSLSDQNLWHQHDVNMQALDDNQALRIQRLYAGQTRQLPVNDQTVWNNVQGLNGNHGSRVEAFKDFNMQNLRDQHAIRTQDRETDNDQTLWNHHVRNMQNIRDQHAIKMQVLDDLKAQRLLQPPTIKPTTTEQPATTKTPTTQPTTTTTSTTQTSTTTTSTTQPSTTTTSTTQPPTTIASTTEPPTTIASTTQPPTTIASTTEPPTTIASTTEPI